MKRLRVILFFLLLGAVVNVAVAWGCALWIPVQAAGNLTKHTRLVLARAGLDGSHINHRSGYGIYIVQFYMGGYSPISTVVYESGFPWRSMTGWRGSTADREVYLVAPNWLNVFEDGLGPRILPPRPLWSGFSCNTLFYAAILWLLFPGYFTLRRFLRQRRGQCPQCAYDLRSVDHEACPECGTAIEKGKPA